MEDSEALELALMLALPFHKSLCQTWAMQTSQTPLLLHDDAEALALIERIKQKLEEQRLGKKSPEQERSDKQNPRYLFSQNLC